MVSAHVQQLIEMDHQQDLNQLYTERSHLVALVARGYRSWLEADTDPSPGYSWIVFVETPEGQLSWHIHDRDLHLFGDIARRPYIGPAGSSWDGHTTAEKYARLDRLLQREGSR